MKPILMFEVMPTLTLRHERNALKTPVLLLNFPGQQKAKQEGSVEGEQYLQLMRLPRTRSERTPSNK